MLSKMKGTLVVALAGFLVSTNASAYSTLELCEEYEGAGNCKLCPDGQYHRTAACDCLAALDVDEGNVLAATEYVMYISDENAYCSGTVEEASAAVKAAVKAGKGVSTAFASLDQALENASESRAELASAVSLASHAAEVIELTCH